MSSITTKDGAQIYYKDWGTGQPISEADFTEDLKKIDVPTLILHGDDDQIVPIGASAMLTAKLVKGARLKVYEGATQGICSTRKNEVNADLLGFLKA